MLQDRPTTSGATDEVIAGTSLDPEHKALFEWLKDVDSRNTGPGDQIFIYRDLSWFMKLLKRDKRGEIKAVGMSDLVKTHNRNIRALRDAKLIHFRKGRWPGKWFTVGSNEPGSFSS